MGNDFRRVCVKGSRRDVLIEDGRRREGVSGVPVSRIAHAACIWLHHASIGATISNRRTTVGVTYADRARGSDRWAQQPRTSGQSKKQQESGPARWAILRCPRRKN